jgi:GT2 family glycosyltransferase
MNLDDEEGVPSTPSSDDRVSVFTITYNQRDTVLGLLRDLAVQTHPTDRFEVIVLDDGSTDGTMDAVRDEVSRAPYAATLLRRDHEADYLSARRYNECIVAADPSSRVFVQLDDVRARPDLLRQHLKWHTGEEMNVVTGAKFEGDEETWALSSCRRSHLAGPDGTAQIVDAWTAGWAASMSYPRALASLVTRPPHERPYDERMTGWGLHEVELVYRMVLAGARLVYDPAAGVYHRCHTPRTERARGIDRDSAVAIGYERNEQYVCCKHDLTSLPRW